jgi:hypothetical protein
VISNQGYFQHSIHDTKRGTLLTKLNNHTAEKEENNTGTRFINNTTLGRVVLWLGIILLSVWLISGKGYVGSETTWQVEEGNLAWGPRLFS